jgi:TonB family protein
MTSVLCHTGDASVSSRTEGDGFMRRGVAVIAAVLLTSMSIALAQSSPTSTNQARTATERKVTFRTTPAYPDLARKAHLQGIVKVEAVVRANGSVKSTRVVGGNPVLVDAATDAVNKWKFEPSQNETTELIQLTFAPDQN